MKKRTRTEMRMLIFRMQPVDLADYYKIDDDWMYRRNRNLLYVTSKVSAELDRIKDAVIANTKRCMSIGC